MDRGSFFVLLHSPLVGPLTWKMVGEEMRQRGFDVMIPALADSADSQEPFWKQHAESVSKALAQLPEETPLVLAAHSGAGPLLPAIRQMTPNPVRAYVFVDAGIPRDGASRLDLMKSEDPAWANDFQRELERGGRFPTWSFDDLQEVIPNPLLRERMVAELNPRGLDFFTESIPVFKGWPDAPCAYIQFSAAYNQPAAEARRKGWSSQKLEAGHFHMLVEPHKVSELLIQAVHQTSQ